MAAAYVCARSGRYAAVCENASGSCDLAEAGHLDGSDIKAIADAPEFRD
jgi:hypothetical protein